MQGLTEVVVLTLLAGLAMPVGALLARVEQIRPHWLEQELRHSVVAFGGGALLSAVALVLVPEGTGELSTVTAVVSFCCGGLAFMGLDILLYRARTRASQLVAMMSDFIPESIALGAAFAVGSDSAVLLAMLIALQNLPEGFNAFRELRQSGHAPALRLIGMFVLMAMLGPLAGVSGYLWLAQMPEVVAVLMLLAAGGILYSVFQDIAPQVVLDRAWAPPLGAVLGFVLGLWGHMLIAV